MFHDLYIIERERERESRKFYFDPDAFARQVALLVEVVDEIA
jgi:hypothetical protein